VRGIDAAGQGGRTHEEFRSARQSDVVRDGARRLLEGSSVPQAGLDRGPTLEGVDANGIGIRDDIDAFIERNYSPEPQRRAASQLAAHFQKTLRAIPKLDGGPTLEGIDANGMAFAMTSRRSSIAAIRRRLSDTLLDNWR